MNMLSSKKIVILNEVKDLRQLRDSSPPAQNDTIIQRILETPH